MTRPLRIGRPHILYPGSRFEDEDPVEMDLREPWGLRRVARTAGLALVVAAGAGFWFWWMWW